MPSQEEADKINEFTGVSGANEERARFFLQAANWDLMLALSQFYEADASEMGDVEVVHESAVGGVVNFKPTPKEPSQAVKKDAKFGTIRADANNSDEDSDSDDDEGQAFCVGGSDSSAFVMGHGVNEFYERQFRKIEDELSQMHIEQELQLALPAHGQEEIDTPAGGNNGVPKIKRFNVKRKFEDIGRGLVETSEIFVGNLQKDVSSELLKAKFGAWPVKEVVSKNDFAFITFAQANAAERAAEQFHGKELWDWGLTMIVEVIKPPVTVNPDGSKNKPKRPLYKPNLSKHPKHKGKPTETEHVLYVANVSRYVTWQDLKDVMSLSGRVCSCHVHRKREGFGEVYYADAKAVKDAMKFLTGFEMQGRPLSFLTKAAFDALPPVEPKPRKVYTNIEQEDVDASDDKPGLSSSGAPARAPVEMEIDSAMDVMKRLQAQDPAKLREMLQTLGIGLK